MRFTYSQRKIAKLFANRGDPDQTPHSAASDLGLHCLPVTLLRVFRLQWVNLEYWHVYKVMKNYENLITFCIPIMYSGKCNTY